MFKYISLLCAAGVGSRMQAEVPKQYLKLNYQGEQKSLLEIVEQKFSEHVDASIVALHEEDKYCANLEKFKDFKRYSESNSSLLQEASDELYFCWGYGQRINTVYSLLANSMELCLRKGWDPAKTFVLIHDVARPCITSQDISNIISFCKELDSIETIIAKNGEAVLAGLLPVNFVVDSVKKYSEQFAQENIPRDNLVLAQTPQTFNLLYLYYILTKLFIALDEPVDLSKYYHSYNKYLVSFSSLQALENSKIADKKLLYNNTLTSMANKQIIASLTDESSVMVYLNDLVKIVKFGRHNLKVTLPDDLPLAQFYINLGN
ncbi:hypothetical protein CKF54_01735 [Psittacicella hinzii]|uniref:2-C-methyl-D-erythritol 4-phosphate cytidylyltransferase n=1 Tax=Psittacicella hinzii TaxID=2028575 RepID=A0A3A1YAF9_9GAMM|nr:2-C-methyl-D-erythritol 4-phosphate cytidylyltransferase [Psittacicella hinzii]RIY34178.1 hypothetical protein CKF54_01735 [Psittacicella hinzii]